MSKEKTANSLENVISSDIVKFIQDYKGWSLKEIGEVVEGSESLKRSDLNQKPDPLFVVRVSHNPDGKEFLKDLLPWLRGSR